LRYPEKINKILPRVIKSLNLDEKFKELEMVKYWKDIVGEKISHHARAININEANLYVVVDNPVWQAQLFLLKNKILKKFNELGANLRDIKFIIEKGGSFKE
jgi:predicted nucleic acid-binding Zn ribbon protein